jgi:hypothetical protein
MIEVIVKTITTCDRCGTTQEREGKKKFDYPPEGWANLSMIFRKADPDGQHGTGGRTIEMDLCPSCAAEVEQITKAEPKPTGQ